VLFWFPFVLIFPLITMRTYADEFRMGTIETLATAPVSDWQIVLAKFLGALLFYILIWAPSFLYFGSLSGNHRQTGSPRRRCVRGKLPAPAPHRRLLRRPRLPRLRPDQRTNQRGRHDLRRHLRLLCHRSARFHPQLPKSGRPRRDLSIFPPSNTWQISPVASSIAVPWSGTRR
jgi:hypothetical protein